MDKPVLVTGAYGFIGRHVARCLAAQGRSVIGIGHGVWSRDEWRNWGIAEWHTADVTLDSLVTYAGQPEFVIHCAGGSSVPFANANPYQDYHRTVTTTASVLEFVRLHAPGAAVVFPSSAAVYGQAPRVPIRESDPIQPVSPYGEHKRMGEVLCESYASHFGVRAAIVRLFSVYGNGLRKQLLWDGCSRISRGECEFAGTGQEQRDWLHVTDAATLLVLACQHASARPVVVNGGTGAGVSVADIVQHMMDCFGKKQVPRFSGQRRAGDPPAYVASMEAVARWGWSPRQPWREGVKDYVRWFAGEN